MPARISQQKSAAFSGEIAWEWFRYAIAESATEVRLFTVGKETFVPEKYDFGILFGLGAELRWRRRRSGLFHTVLVDDEATEGVEVEALPAEDPPEQIILWGEPQGGVKQPTWYEPRIPRMITEYPGKLAGKRVAVRLKRYRLKVWAPQPPGEKPVEKPVILFRCTDLVAAKVEE